MVNVEGHPYGCACRRCLAYREELAGRHEMLDVLPSKRPWFWQPRPGTAKALTRVGRGEDKRRQARYGGRAA